MVRKKPLRFDLKAFLERAGDGRTILEPQEKQTLFSQGDSADAVFYILKGKVKLTVLSRHGKEAVIAMLTAASDANGSVDPPDQTAPPSTSAALAVCESLKSTSLKPT